MSRNGVRAALGSLVVALASCGSSGLPLNCFDVVKLTMTDRDGRTGSFIGELATHDDRIAFACPPEMTTPDLGRWCSPAGATVPIGPKDGYDGRPPAVDLMIRELLSDEAGPREGREIVRGAIPVDFQPSEQVREECRLAEVDITWGERFSE
jgi:hypothetical protein